MSSNSACPHFRVLHLIDHLGLGGAQRSVRDLVENWSIRGKVGLFALRKTSQDISINIPTIKVCDSESRISIRPFWTLIKLIRENDFDVLHCHLLRSHLVGLA